MDILLLMLPIFIMIGLGSLFVSIGWFPFDGLPVLGRLITGACIPVLVFSALTRGDNLASFAWTEGLVYAGASLGSVALLWAALRFQRVPSAQSTILALGGATANSIFLGFPVALAVLPERATEVFAWVIFAEAAIIMPVVSTLALLAERSEGERVLVSSLKALFRSPVVLGLLAGFAFSASGLRLPGWADTVVNSIVAAAPFLALFVIGGNVLRFRLSRSGPRVMTVAIGKLVVHPLVVGLSFWTIYGPDAPVVRDAVLFAAMPLFLLYPAFCQRHCVGEVGSSAVVMSTALGAITVPFVLSLLS